MNTRLWTIRELLKVTTDYLCEKNITSPRLNAEVLLAHQLQIDRLRLYLNLDKPLTEKEISGYRALIKRRAERCPLQYLTGTQEFWSLDLHVSPEVLIPRPESEILIEQTVLRVNSLMDTNFGPQILDLGTGSGALAIAIAKEISTARVWATDISQGALNVARINAEKHRVSNRINFLHGDLWIPLENKGIAFDFILSNPPYVAPEEFSDLAPEVRLFEPRLALDGLEDGMYYIEKIINEAYVFMNKGGFLFLEMAPGQTGKALQLISQLNAYCEDCRIRDYSNHYRVVTAKKA